MIKCVVCFDLVVLTWRTLCFLSRFLFFCFSSNIYKSKADILFDHEIQAKSTPILLMKRKY